MSDFTNQEDRQAGLMRAADSPATFPQFFLEKQARA
jgi:hypothetical protein